MQTNKKVKSKTLTPLTLFAPYICLLLLFLYSNVYADTTDDICYNDLELSGLCMGFGFCSGGLNCQKTYPLQINSSIKNVKIYYNETGMGGSFGSSCGVDPSGTCQTDHSVDMGPFGFLGQATEFDLGDVDQNTNDPDIWTKNLMGMSCFSGDRLYVTYIKDGVKYKKKLKKCSEVQNGGNKFRDFAIRNPEDTRNIKGNVKFIGNTVLEYNGDNTDEKTNSDLDLKYVDVDNNSSTYNSSKAKLDMPTDSTIVWAGLYTQGYLKGITSVNIVYQKLNNPMYLTASSIGTISVIPDVIDYANNDGNGSTYDTYSELKALEGKKASEVNGWITAANIKCYEGTDNSGLGNFGAWTLVVIYKNPNAKLKNISVFDGYKEVYNGTGHESVDIPISGFLTPLHGDINSTLSLFVGEGDKYITGDKLYVDDTVINDTNAFDSSITGVTRDPNIVNNQGIDIQNHNISSIISNGDTSADINLTSDGDMYFPSVIAFATDLYEPRVCYYINNIKDDNNHIIFKDGQFLNGTQIDSTKEYKFNLWISNMKKNSNDNIENAKNVQIYVNAPEFNYTLNSTQIKNIGDSAYSSITDQVGDDIGEYNSSTKNFTWRLGTGANANQGGNINVANGFDDNSSKAFIKLQGRFSNIEENQTSIDISNYYNFRASFRTDSITVAPENALPIEACVKMDTNANVYVHPKGLFDAWDTFRSINDRNISTKIVNQDFNLTIASINLTNDATETKDNIDIQYQLYDMNNHTNITNWMEYNASSGKDGASAIKTFNVNSARKNVRVRFKFCGHNNGNGIVLSSLSGCPSSDINTSTYSSDNFAVRPNRFKIILTPTSVHAGDDFNISFEALDINDANTTNYDENNITDNSFKIEYIDNNKSKGCINGSLTFHNNKIIFNNGGNTTIANYNEVGNVDINISDKNIPCEQRFAVVDCKDSNVSKWSVDKNLSIGTDDVNITFTPDHFNISSSFKNKGQNFTYISKDLNMSALLDINVTAETKNNKITSNYNSACYAQKTDYNISYANLNISPSNALTRILYVETNTYAKGNNSINSNDINLTNISSSIFSTDNNGTGSIQLKINFDRNKSKAVNPFDLNVTDINITDTDGTKGIKNLTGNSVRFFYGRVHAPDYSAENNTTISNAKIYYEVYCKDCGKSQYPSLGKESVDGVYWYINSAHNSINDGNISNFLNSLTYNTSNNLIFTPPKSPNNISNGIENHTITYNGNSYPYKENVDINASKWLIYNPYDKTAKYNSFNVEFYGVGGWAGVGDINQTVDLNISIKKSKRLEW